MGFQKMTLLDFPNKVACTVFTGGCNFRCPFCHNALLVTQIDPSTSYNNEDIFSYLASRKGLLDGVCVTGGEPLVQKDVEDFIKRVKDMGFLLKLDTNGSFPDRLSDLVEKKLVDYVAMDIKNCKEKYGETVGVPSFDISPIEKSVELLKSGVVDYEFRTTVVKEFHTVENIEKTAEWIKGTKKYFLQNFKDSGNLIKDGLSAVDKNDLSLMQKRAEEILGFCGIRGV